MIKYLSVEEIITIDEIILKRTNEKERFQVKSEYDIKSAVNFVKNNFRDDLYKKALGYCISLFVYHPFQDGNHRTSLTTAERFLVINDFHTDISDNKRKKLQKWRVDYEDKYDLEREFFYITCIEDESIRHKKIKEVMNSEYGIKIGNWLKRNYKLKLM